MQQLERQRLIQLFPVEEFQMSELEDEGVAFGNGTVVKGVRVDHRKELVCARWQPSEPHLRRATVRFRPARKPWW